MGLFDGMPAGLEDFLGAGTSAPPHPFPVPGTIDNGMIGIPTAPPSMQSPISPEFLAKNAAARGIPPPPVDVTPGSVGAALTGQTVPLPQARPTVPVMAQGGGAPGAPMDITSDAQKASAGPQQPGAADRIASALKGIKAPANPEVQRISSPSLPRTGTAIKGGDLIAMLQALQSGNKTPGGLDLPGTLGSALRR